MAAFCFHVNELEDANKNRIVGGRITAIEVQKRNPQRVNVHIDGHFALGLAAIEAARLKVGQQLSAVEITRLKERDEIEVAHDRVLNLLSYRPRSVAEVRRRLSDNQFDTHTIDKVVDRLSQADLLNDEAFARYWLENRDTFKPRSSRALRYELRQKGIADSVIDAILTSYDEDDAAYRAALGQAQKLTRQTKDAFVLRSKLLAFLSRGGFSFDTSRTAVDRLLTELDEKEGWTHHEERGIETWR
jgi:regulatory protein